MTFLAFQTNPKNHRYWKMVLECFEVSCSLWHHPEMKDCSALF